jgi:flagellar biosynthetic protein FliS
MDPHAAYRQNSFTATTRIDLLLALYDGAIERIAVAMTCLREDNKTEALKHLTRAQLIVAGIASGIRPQTAPQIGVPTLKLCEFVAYQITQSNLEGLSSALTVLNNLRDGFAKIRSEAAHLERTGQIPPADAVNSVHAVA